VFRRRPFVFELRDLWPESIKTVGAMNDSLALRLLERLERFLYRWAAAVVVVTEAFRHNLIARGIDPHKIAVVINGVDLSRFHPLERDLELVERHGLAGKFIAGYIGTHGLAHGLETLLEAAAALCQQPDGDRFRLLFLGDGARKAALVARARAMGLDNVVFIDSVPKAEVVRYWSLLDVSIIHLQKKAEFTKVIPSKLFEGMGMAIPVLHGVGRKGPQPQCHSKDKGVAPDICREAVQLGVAFLDKGHYPYIPHLAHFIHYLTPRRYEVWMMLDEAWLRRCDILVRLHGESAGADHEVAVARAHSIPVVIGKSGETVKSLVRRTLFVAYGVRCL